MRGEIIYEYHKLSPEDQKTVRRWLCVNVVVGAILVTGLIVLAVNVPGDESKSTDQHATIHPKLSPERASTLPSR
jgi:hypothetical protein